MGCFWSATKLLIYPFSLLKCVKWDWWCICVFHCYLNEPPWYSSGRSFPSRAFWASACQIAAIRRQSQVNKTHSESGTLHPSFNFLYTYSVIQHQTFNLYCARMKQGFGSTLMGRWGQSVNFLSARDKLEHRTWRLSYRSKYVPSLEREKHATANLLFRHQQQLRRYKYNHMFIYSVLHSTDHHAKKKSDDKLCPLEGIYSSAVFRCKYIKCWSNERNCSDSQDHLRVHLWSQHMQALWFWTP